MDQTTRYLLAFLVPLVATLALTPLVARVAHRLDILDRPAANKFHVRATPYLGGLAIAGGLMAVAAFTTGYTGELVTILAGGVAMFALGLVDDVRTVSPRTKVVAQAGAGLALWFAGVRGGLFGSVADLPFTILWVVAVTNAVNLLDNMDGVLSGVAAVSALAFFVIAAERGDYLVGSFALAVAAASLGFLRYNFPPARIFLGDAGSMLLGFLLAAIGLKLDLVGPTGLARTAIPVLVLGVPLFDTLLVVVARLRDRRPVLRGATDHTSHRLVSLGLTGHRVAVVAYVTQVAMAAVAVWLVHASQTSAVITVGVACVAAGAGVVALLRTEPTGTGAERYRSVEGSNQPAGAPSMPAV